MGKRERHAHGADTAIVTSEGNKLLLGFEGEFMNQGQLFIPVPNTDRHIMVAERMSGKYGVITQSKWLECDNILMLACLVQELLDEYDVTSNERLAKASEDAFSGSEET